MSIREREVVSSSPLTYSKFPQYYYQSNQTGGFLPYMLVIELGFFFSEPMLKIIAIFLTVEDEYESVLIWDQNCSVSFWISQFHFSVLLRTRAILFGTKISWIRSRLILSGCQKYGKEINEGIKIRKKYPVNIISMTEA